MAHQSVERIKTGIQGFDGLIEGGIPRGYAVLLSGSPGTGKTIFGMEFLVHGVRFKENGLFITFEETPDNLIMQIEQFGTNLRKLREENRVIIKAMPEQENLNETILFKMIEDALADHNIKRLVLDSLNTYANNILSFEEEAEKPLSDSSWNKRVIYRLIKRLQKYPEITKLLISETEEGKQELSKDEVSQFLCDGVIKIEYMSMGGEYARQLKVRKMRSTKNNSDLFPMEISGKGIIIHSNHE